MIDETPVRERIDPREHLVVKGSWLVPAFLVGFAVLLLLATGIDWSEPISESTSPSFSENGADFADFDALARRLTAPSDTDHASKFVWAELSDGTRAALSSKYATRPSREAREALLAADLNSIIESGYSIYTPERFPSESSKWMEDFTLRLQDTLPLSDTPHPADSQVVVVHLGDPLTIRVIEYPAVVVGGTIVSGAAYIHLTPEDLFRSERELDSLSNALRIPALKVHHDRAAVPNDVAKPHLRGIIHFVRYTGLGHDVDHYLRKGDARNAAEDQWLNRFLLERAFQKEITAKNDRRSTDFFGGASRHFARSIAADIPPFFRSQVWTVWILALCSLIPALAGLILRRAFWRWFLATFSILFAVNTVAAINGWGHVGASMTSGLQNPYGKYLWVESLLILLMLAFRLQRYSAAAVDPGTRRNNMMVAALLTLAAIAWIIGMATRLRFDLYQVGGASLVLLVARAIYLQSRASANDAAAGARNIVVCLDGTWNQPGTKDFGHLAETNVYKLFHMLKGRKSRRRHNASRSKEYLDDAGTPRQVAFYYQGVGNALENSELGQFLGGTFGMGADAIVERAYLDVVRTYRPGDRIFIFGFSRGAAIARLLAGVIGRRDIPRSLWTLRIFGRHRLVRRSSRVIDEAVPVTVDVLGCWDTVGAFGIAKNVLGIPFQRINLLKDLGVADCVKRAYHMLALDEDRDAFEPTLMEPDPTAPNRVVEVWFSGNHSNVGGGYSTDNLSDVALDFLLRHVSSGYASSAGMHPGRDESWGLYLSAAKRGVSDDALAVDILDPDPCGQLRHSTGPLYTYVPRTLPLHAVIHDTVFERMASALPIYAPRNIFGLNERLIDIRALMEVEVKRLAETHSIDAAMTSAILQRSDANLFLMKWSKYLDSHLSDGVPLRAKLRIDEELRNPAA